MPAALPSLPPDQLAAGQVVLAVLLGTAGFFFLLPRPRGRSVVVGVALSLAALVVGTLYLALTFGLPATDTVGPALFWLFAGAALVFGGSTSSARRTRPAGRWRSRSSSCRRAGCSCS